MTKKYMKKLIGILILAILLFMAPACSSPPAPVDSRTFAEVRAEFTTALTKQTTSDYDVPEPPAGIFETVYYQSSVGDLAAYVSCDPQDGKQHPLIIWVVGGWGNSISPVFWSYPDWDNDQTACAFREAGMLMMYPSFRGGNKNPGYQESLYGEIDDIAAAYEFAASLPYVDTNRIYLGGHSTGGTRALLAAAYTDVFRAVFCFGPVGDIKEHNQSQFTFDSKDAAEVKMRSPINWLKDINSPTFVIEGSCNSSEVRKIEKASQNGNLHCFVVNDTDHYGVLAPVTILIAEKMKYDTGTECNITLTSSDIQSVMKMQPITPMPVMKQFVADEIGVQFLIPAIWSAYLSQDETGLVFYSDDYGYEDNFWDTSMILMRQFNPNNNLTCEQLAAELGLDWSTVSAQEKTINGCRTLWLDYYDDVEFTRVLAFLSKEQITLFSFWLPLEYTDAGSLLFNSIINSIHIGT
ncbi:MAG: prolyl oligopeptidase family serine peptidase [Eubacteriaceae bacterium]|nr:prolyl oligopeptidase family serine peptidase [Eubacteriaceae bacterium]